MFLSHHPRATRPHRTRRARRAAAVAAVTVLVAVVALTACGVGEQPPTPVTAQTMIIFDVSGSTAGAIDGYANRAAQTVDATGDGTRITVLVADGASGSSTCIPRSTDLSATGNNTTDRADSLADQRAAVTTSIRDQISCGQHQNTPGSDLLGSLLTAANKARPGMDASHVWLYSDGIQYSDDFKLTSKILIDAAALKKAIARLDDEGLIPTSLNGADLCISDPAVGEAMTAREAQGVIRFWSAYARKAHTTSQPANPPGRPSTAPDWTGPRD